MKSLSMMTEAELRRKQLYEEMHNIYLALDQHDHIEAQICANHLITVLTAIVTQEKRDADRAG